MIPSATEPQRFWSRVERSESAHPALGTPCWPWTGCVDADGYGRVAFDGRGRMAHRVAYELAVGPIPDGLVIDHLCRTPRCVNPAHLEPVTRGENVRRGVAGALRRAWNLALGRRTHCARGHAFDDANTSPRSGANQGRRNCRACKRAADHTRRARPSAAPQQLFILAERGRCPAQGANAAVGRACPSPPRAGDDARGGAAEGAAWCISDDDGATEAPTR